MTDADVSEAVERLLTIRNGLEDGTLGPTPDLMLEALEAGATLAEEQRGQIAHLSEQVRVAREGLERIVGDADSYRGDRNEYDGGIEVGMDRQAETARETLTRMEKNDD
jgi:hypothetical protein